MPDRTDNTDAARKLYAYAQELKLPPKDASQSLMFAAALIAVLHVSNEEDFALEIEVMVKSFLEWSHRLYLFKDEILQTTH